MDLKALIEKSPIVGDISQARPCVWFNPDLKRGADAFSGTTLSMEDILDAQRRLERFAPFIARCFPETASANGVIESPLTRTDSMRARLNDEFQGAIGGTLFLKRDSDLPIAGSVKARGGIYEVLKHTETLALENGLLKPDGDYSTLASHRDFFSKYKIQVGSTGNLGLSIGISSAAIGYDVTVHMSADAKEWKKRLLREKGVRVVEYASDYSEAVKHGRELSDADPFSYFVDDENSVDLFLGYAVAALRLQKQLTEQNVIVDAEHPLFVYIPCGVGGAPGGVCFGLKRVFGDNVHVFFVEPVQAPCMLLGLASGLNSGICVRDVGLSGLTHADGLAVGRPSGFVGGVVKYMLDGEFTLGDAVLYDYMRALLSSESLFIEPSACAAFEGPLKLCSGLDGKEYLLKLGLSDKMKNAAHIAWATGGRLVPEETRKEYEKTFLE